MGTKYCVGHLRKYLPEKLAKPEGQGGGMRPLDGALSGSGSAKPDDERDRALALREARRMLREQKTPDAVKAQLIRVLAGVEEAKSAAKAPTIEALDALSVPELETLVLAHL